MLRFNTLKGVASFSPFCFLACVTFPPPRCLLPSHRAHVPINNRRADETQAHPGGCISRRRGLVSLRGPAFVDALVLLYRELLNCWKTNEYTLKRGVVCGDDSIAGMWRLLADKTSGFEHVEVGGEKGGAGRAAVQLNPRKPL